MSLVGLKIKIKNVVFIFAAAVISAVISGLSTGVAYASSEIMTTENYTNTTQFSEGTFNATSSSGVDDAASIELCAGGQYCEQYKREITITNDGPLVNSAQVNIQLDTEALINASKMQANCGDIRLSLGSNGDDELTNGRIIDCDTDHTIIDLIVPELAAESDTTIWLWYGSLNTLTALDGTVRQNLDNDMTTSPVPPAELKNDAVYDSINQYVELTPAEESKNGALQYHNSPGDNFDFTTQFNSGGGDGADGIYLYMGATRAAQNEYEDFGGYAFIYDEYHDYIGLQFQGQGLKAVFCPGTGHGAGELPFEEADMTDSAAACNLDDGTWKTARVVRSGNHIQMYLDGVEVIDYQPDSLPTAVGQYMGWGARTGGSHNFHRIRNLELTITESSIFEAPDVVVGVEESTTGVATTGSWVSPVYEFGTEDDNRGIYADGNEVTVALSGSYSNMSAGDTIDVHIKSGDNETQLAANSNQLLETISYTSDTGTFDYTVEEINNVLYTSKLAQFTITINRAGITSPKIDDIEFKYTPDYYTAPSVPLNVATANADKRSVDLTWEAPVDDGNNYNSFYIEAKFADQDGWEDVVYDESESEGTTSTNIVLPRLGEDYIIRIQVENNYGESDWVELEYSTPEPEVFHITDCEELQAINDNSVYWGDTYILDNNIDCSDSVSWNSGAGFIPIAFDNADDFTGMLDGQGFTISDLYINQPDYEDIGLFSELEYATVTNVNFTGAEIVGYGHAGVIAGSTRGNVTVNEVAIASETSVSTTESGYVGGLFGYYDDSGAASTITDVDISATLLSADDCNMGGLIGYADAYSGLTVDQVHTTVDITGECSLGGLIGRGEGDITVTDTQTEGTIDISYEYGGGLFGEYNQGEDNDDVSEMTNNSSSIDLTLSGTESENIGGLFGYLDDGSSNLTFNKNFATGDITQLEEDISAGDIGGLIGEADEVVITNAYATGDVYVPSADAVGGLVGYLDNSASLDNTYASGDVTGIDEVGGLVGSADGEVSDSFAVGMVSGGESEISVAGLVGDGYVCTEEDECNPGESFELTNSYYDKPSTGQDLCYVAETYDEELDDYVSAEVDGCTTTYNADRYFNPANAPLSSWNFDTVWGAHQNSYPDFELGENPVFPDDDNDGVDDEVESEAPNNGDANNDGTPDSEQANVASYINSVTGSYSVVETSCGSNFNVQDGAESVSDNDAAYDYPAGLVGFVGLSCGAPGSSVTVNLFYYGDYSSSDFVLRKWNSANAYSVIDGAALENVTIDGKKALQASYTVVDGGELDQDGVADGNIRDPAGPAVLVVGSPNTGL